VGEVRSANRFQGGTGWNAKAQRAARARSRTERVLLDEIDTDVRVEDAQLVANDKSQLAEALSRQRIWPRILVRKTARWANAVEWQPVSFAVD
jgi:hypothetical protein